LMSTF